MRTARRCKKVRIAIEPIAAIRTSTAVIDVAFHGHAAPLGPLFVFSGPLAPNTEPVVLPCGCNVRRGHVIARTVEEVRMLRDALSVALERSARARLATPERA